MSGKSKINLEVHTLQRGKWELHSRYPGSKKQLAMQDAKSLEKISTVIAVKIIEEKHNSSKNSTTQSTIYDTSPKKAPRPKATRKKHDANASRQAMDEKYSSIGIVTKLLFVALVSVAIGGISMALSTVWLRKTSFATDTQTKIMLAVFIVTFMVSVISMGMSVISKHPVSQSKKKATAPPPPLPKPGKKIPEYNPQKEPANPSVTSDEEIPGDAEPKDKKEEQTKEQDADKEDDPAFVSPYVDTQYKFTIKFLDSGLEKVKISHDMKSKFNKFGINLFLAGACDTLGQQRNLDDPAKILVLGKTIKGLGFKKEESAKFAENYHDYLLADSRYMQMFQAGRNAMNNYVGKQADTGKLMDKALTEWNKPKQKDEKTGPVTVMFTDMVGSTALTQSSGDAIAQKVVRAHNRIVRNALTEFIGKEIKHTGDGIMASFANTSNGIEAAIAIQRKTASHNKTNSDLPLHIKIGINAGEPIAEDDDLFGSTVQLSARIVDKAQSEEILVSEIVRGICAGKEILFFDRGKFEMKGFENALNLYEVIWDDDVSIDDLKKRAAQENKPTETITDKEKTPKEDKKEAPVADKQTDEPLTEQTSDTAIVEQSPDPTMVSD